MTDAVFRSAQEDVPITNFKNEAHRSMCLLAERLKVRKILRVVDHDLMRFWIPQIVAAIDTGKMSVDNYSYSNCITDEDYRRDLYNELGPSFQVYHFRKGLLNQKCIAVAWLND